MKKAMWTLLAMGVAGAGAAALFVALGLYDISATRQHTQAVYTLLETTMHQSVERQARAVRVPPPGRTRSPARGALCYQAHCVQCHGGPGTAQGPMGRSMQPLPGPLVDASARWSPAELYWITRHGIKMSGMPAWQHHIAEDDLWALVAFLQRLPRLTAAEFRAATAATTEPHGAAVCAAPQDATRLLPADALRGQRALTQFACSACHLIPGVTGSRVHVGPPLAGVGSRSLIAGAVANTPEQMVRWIRAPQSVDPMTTMPDMQVGEQDARDMAAFLATLR